MIFVTGATGFLGSHFMGAIHKKGLQAKCLVRSPQRGARCTARGFNSVLGNVTDRESLKGALGGVDTVAHLVGIIEERGGQTFQKVHFEGTANVVEEAAVAGVKHFIYVSALGADIDSPFPYAKTKAQAEAEIKSSGIPFTIIRPSLVIGPGGGFVGKMLDLVNFPGPFMPVPGSGETMFQPIFVDDLVQCIVSTIDNPDAIGKTYEIGGPEHLSYNDLLRILTEVTGKRKRLLHVPMGVMMPSVKVLEKTGLSPVTSDQLGMLSIDNVCDTDSVSKEFGFEPITYRRALELSILQRAQGR
jgi:NADH dehydrogenase